MIVLPDALYLLAQTAAPTSQPVPDWFRALQSFGPLLLIGVVLIFFMSGSKRKQDRERKTLLDSAKKGDRVQMIGGELGSIVDVRDDRVLVKVDESSNTKIWFVRSAISRIGEEEEKKA